MRNTETRRPLPQGFTLIELLIVVAIIAILAAIAVPNFLEAQVRSKVSRAKSDMRSMVTATEAYCVDHNHYMLFFGCTSPKDVAIIERNYSVVEDALFSLTSPIAYMSALPRFAPFGNWRGYSPTDEPLEGYYYMGPDVWEARNPNPRSYDFPESYTDVVYSFQAIGPSKELGGENRDAFEPYDATNGTQSNGEIIYIKSSSPMHSFH